MKQNTMFSKLDFKLFIEAILRSSLWGVALGALAAFITATVCWFLDEPLLWVAIVSFFVFGAISGTVVYFLKFRPSVAANAKRLDRLGLDERAITMVELADDDSFIAKKQREDALEKIAMLEPKDISIRVSALVITLCCVFMLLFVGMSTVEGLSSAGYLPSGSELWEQYFPTKPLPKYKLVYEASKGGTLMGETEQIVEQGHSGELVIALPNEGYMFLCWSDGSDTPYRIDKDVRHNAKLTALFAAVEDFNDPGNDEDQPDDAPGGDGDQETNDPDAPPSGGEKYVEVNQIIDGQTYYRDVIDEYIKAAMEYLGNDENIPEHIRKLIENYYSTIE